VPRARTLELLLQVESSTSVSFVLRLGLKRLVLGVLLIVYPREEMLGIMARALIMPILTVA